MWDPESGLSKLRGDVGHDNGQLLNKPLAIPILTQEVSDQGLRYGWRSLIVTSFEGLSDGAVLPRSATGHSSTGRGSEQVLRSKGGSDPPGVTPS